MCAAKLIAPMHDSLVLPRRRCSCPDEDAAPNLIAPSVDRVGEGLSVPGSRDPFTKDAVSNLIASSGDRVDEGLSVPGRRDLLLNWESGFEGVWWLS